MNCSNAERTARSSCVLTTVWFRQADRLRSLRISAFFLLMPSKRRRPSKVARQEAKHSQEAHSLSRTARCTAGANIMGSTGLLPRRFPAAWLPHEARQTQTQSPPPLEVIAVAFLAMRPLELQKSLGTGRLRRMPVLYSLKISQTIACLHSEKMRHFIRCQGHSGLA
jgi:hypothetical protein